MNVYVYSDESGVFDNEHYDYFVFAGLIIFGFEEKEVWSRKYSKAERDIRQKKADYKDMEIKAVNVTNKEKNSLFRSLNNCCKFSVIIKQQHILQSIYNSKKVKQRYLDYVYKIAVKNALIDLIEKGCFKSDEIERMYFYADEHSTATNGRYELKENLEQEFKWGTYNQDYTVFNPPIFKNLKSVSLEFCNSKTKLLVRAADIVANKVFYLIRFDSEKLEDIKNLHITYFPNK